MGDCAGAGAAAGASGDAAGGAAGAAAAGGAGAGVPVVTLIPGDGIGPEITAAMQDVVAASGAHVQWDVQQAGEGVIAREGTPLPPQVVQSIRRNKVALKGPVTTPIGTGFRSINVSLRKELDLFINLRPALSLVGTGARYDNVDIVLFRENTEDLYAGIEFEAGSDGAARLAALVQELGAGTIRPDAGLSIKPISVYGTRRIMRAAIDYALANGRRKITIVHKANIMKHSDGLFLRTCREVAQEMLTPAPANAPAADATAPANAPAADATAPADAPAAPALEIEDCIVDALCMRLVINPADFDVLVCPNLYGDIVSDLCAGLVGGLGLAPGANIGQTCALFEPVHGSAPTIAGQNIANPTALILSAALMLRHLGQRSAAERIQAAVADVIAAGDALTCDLALTRYGSTDRAVTTTAFAAALTARLGK